MEKLKMHSPDLVAGNVEKIAALFPNCITETKDAHGKIVRSIDFDLLKQELANSLTEGRKERYQLDWPGKREAILAANAPIAKTLRPRRAESVDFDSTRNLFIEGDNLETLKLLQEAYLGRVKMIYIDPPYNTGGDFLYDDDFSTQSSAYLLNTTQKTEESGRLVSNLESNGRFHSDWLSSLYPRLKLAQKFLSRDGVIFISIDDNEYPNLFKLCEEVFGGSNYCGTFIWEKKKKPSFLNTNMGTITEYVLAFARDRSYSPPFAAGTVEDGKKYPFNNAGNGIKDLEFPAGSVLFKCSDGTIEPQDMSEGNIVTELLDKVQIQNGRNLDGFRIRGEWRYSQEKLNEFVKQGAEIIISKIPFRPNYINRSGEIKKTANFLSHRTNNVPTNEDATNEVRALFGSDVMSHPKPTGLIQYLIRTVTSDDDLIMDFYAGSATTAHAVMNTNAEDGAERRYIMVQLDESCDTESEAFKAGFTTIAQLAQERIRRAGIKIKHDNAASAPSLDVGFRSLRLSTSNMNDVYYTPDTLTQSHLLIQAENIKDDRTPEDLLFQVLIDWGVDLALPIEKQSISGKSVFLVDTDALAACFDTDIDESLITYLANRKPLRAVFRDSCFADDSARINIEQIFKMLSPSTQLKGL